MPELIFRFFLLLLVFAPLAFGTTGLWSLTLLQAGCSLLLLLCLHYARRSKLPLYSPPGALPLLLLCGFMALQAVPLPPEMLELLSPVLYKRYQESVWVLRPGCWMPLSVNRGATLAEFFRVASYVAFYFAAVQILAERERLKKTVFFISLFAGLFSLAGIFQFILPGDRIFWFGPEWPARTAHHFGTYVNGNHYAGLMEMLLPVMLAFFLASKPRVRYLSWREGLVEFFDNPASGRHVLLGFGALIVATSIFLSLSRGGILSTLASLLIFGFFLLLRKEDRKRGAFLVLFIAVMFFAVGLFGWDPILERFDRIRNAQGEIADLRLTFWQDSARIIADHLFSGSGFGTFFDIYPPYQTAATGDLIVDHAHNDYVELLTDGGLVGAFLVGWFLCVLLWKSFRSWRRRRSGTSTYLYLGSLAGLAAVLFHSVTDFNLHIGANGLYFFFLASLVVAASGCRSRGGEGIADLPVCPPAFPPLATVALTLLLVAGLAFGGGRISALTSFSQVDKLNLREVTSRAILPDMREKAERAAAFAPFESVYAFALGNIGLALGDFSSAEKNYSEALRLRPLTAEVLQQAGIFFDYRGEAEKAERLLRAGARNHPQGFERQWAYASHLLGRGKTEAGIVHIRQTLARNPEKTEDFLTLMVLSSLDDERIREAIPERSLAHLSYGDYLAQRGRGAAAERSYQTAIRLAKEEKNPKRNVFWSVYKYYRKSGRDSEALAALLAGIELFPGKSGAGFRRSAAVIYEKQGIFYRAIEEYRRALLLEPGSEWARKRLEGLEGKAEG